MIATKMGKCVVCRDKVRLQREFLPQIDMFNTDTPPITKEMAKQIMAWRDEPLVCDPCAIHYTVRKVEQ